MARRSRHMVLLAAVALLVLGPLPVPVSAGPPEFGTITGTFVDPSGRPVSGARVVAHSLRAPWESTVTTTASDGRFSMRPAAGDYRLHYQPLPPLLYQWGSGKEAEPAADIVTIEADKVLLIEEKALPIGRVVGRLLDAAGQPVEFGEITIENPSLGRSFHAISEPDGVWSTSVRPGTYTVRFDTVGLVQWAHEKKWPNTADPITVAADKTTVVDEKLAPTGSLTVRAVDTTGLPVLNFCAEVHTYFVSDNACSDLEGVAQFPVLSDGTYTLKVSDGEHLDSTTTDVRVTGGQPSTVTAALRQAATVEVTVTDAATGEPVGGVCLTGLPAEHATEYGGYIDGCADSSGLVTISRVAPDRYAFFASVFDGVYGSQWVGAQGGVGSQREAAVVTAREGETAKLEVRLDHAGQIAGVVTDAATGKPLDNFFVLPGFSGGYTEPDGSYVLPRLGPYQWVVQFGSQWSGGSTSRFEAEPIPVRANETTTYNMKVDAGATLTGRVTGPDGQPPDFAQVFVVNSKSFDILDIPAVRPDGSFTSRLAGPQEVKLQLVGSVGRHFVVRWYPNAPDFAQGQAVPIPASGTVTTDIPIR
jgi:Carboxypeptidase regulatory-like domain